MASSSLPALASAIFASSSSRVMRPNGSFSAVVLPAAPSGRDFAHPAAPAIESRITAVERTVCLPFMDRLLAGRRPLGQVVRATAGWHPRRERTSDGEKSTSKTVRSFSRPVEVLLMNMQTVAAYVLRALAEAQAEGKASNLE